MGLRFQAMISDPGGRLAIPAPWARDSTHSIPSFAFWINHDNLRAPPPAAGRQVLLDSVLHLLAGRVITAPASVEHHQCVPAFVDATSHVLRRRGPTSRVSLEMLLDGEIDGTDSKTRGTSQQSLHGLHHVQTRDDCAQIPWLRFADHPETSEANSKLMSAELRQSDSLGCRSTEMMSVAPSSFFAKHRIPFGSAQFK